MDFKKELRFMVLEVFGTYLYTGLVRDGGIYETDLKARSKGLFQHPGYHFPLFDLDRA
jgi:hypothetical protein